MDKLDKLKDIKKSILRKSAQGFIKQVKNASSADEERKLIANESSSIRNDLAQSVSDTLCENLKKLIFIYLLGYPCYFGQMASIQLINMTGYEEKRIGYLAMSLLINESSDLLLLTVNSIKNDIANSNPFLSLVRFILGISWVSLWLSVVIAAVNPLLVMFFQKLFLLCITKICTFARKFVYRWSKLLLLFLN